MLYKADIRKAITKNTRYIAKKVYKPEYSENYANQGWEVDALPPEVLHTILENQILSEINADQFDHMKELEEDHIAKLTKLTEQL
jgi:hypothetical protein